MNKTILFSPVGGTDPISIANMQDGSILHICRYYRPDEVILYMSKEILELHKKDNRFEDAINRLAKLQDREIVVHRIERPELNNVQEFDFFYGDFKKLLVQVRESLDGSDLLLVNISSGTPAMKSGLLVLITLGEIQCKAIQVSTPVRAMQEHEHKGFDLDFLWEINPDNENGINRCKEVYCPTLSSLQKEEIIKKHLLAYDYPAALSVAEELPEEKTRSYLPLLMLAKARASLDPKAIGKYSQNNAEGYFPIWESDKRGIFEYALAEDIKRKKEEYADFMRAFTPLFVTVVGLILKNECGFEVDDYVYLRKGGEKIWKIDKIPDKLREHLDKSFNGGFQAKNVLSVHLIKIVEFYSKDAGLIELLTKLREVEERIRNIAAHQIVAISDQTIKEKTGYTSKQVMTMIKKLFYYSGIKVKERYWDSYDDMNSSIVEKIDKAYD